jgi:hypothetical protein
MRVTVDDMDLTVPIYDTTTATCEISDNTTIDETNYCEREERPLEKTNGYSRGHMLIVNVRHVDLLHQQLCRMT